MNLASRVRLNVTIALSLLALAIPSASAASYGFIRINEFMANNAHYTNADGNATDWVELYNISSTTAVNLRTYGYSLTDSNVYPYRYIFNWDVIIPPNGIYLITCDSTKPASAANAPFGLGKNGGNVFLYTNGPMGAVQVDSVPYGLQPVDYSVGRVPDGTGSFVLCTPTMWANNQSLALGLQGVLKLNEWMADDGNSPDWFEIYNPTNRPVSLAGLKFYVAKDGVTSYPLPALSFIGCTYASAYQQVICDKTVTQDPYLANHLNISLSKSAETLIMEYSTGLVIDSRSFTNAEQHVSEGRLPDGSTNILRFYGVGDNLGPTPGALNAILLTNPIVNEVLIHTDPPLEDAVEIQNRGTTNLDISGWWISNDRSTPKKAIIPPGPAIPPGGFRVIYQYMFNTNLDQTPQYPASYAYRTNILECFTFNSAHGDQVHLFEVNPNTGLLTGNEVSEVFESSANAWSFGHYDTTVPGDYKFVTMSRRTFGHDNPLSIPDFRLGAGLSNAYPLVGPVVLNEIMYMPYTNFWNGSNWVDDPNMEYIELHNLTSTNVPLFYHDLSRLDFNTNSWRLQTALNYTFASNSWMGPYSFCLVVGFDPKTNSLALTNFCKRYGVTNYNVTTNTSSTNYVRIVGPWTGRLNNTGDAIELYRPDEPQQAPHPDAGYVPYVRVDKVNYLSHSEWTTDAGGNSNSLQRLNSVLFGNDPINWVATRPSAGQPNPLGDNDGDGMPNDWEILYGFNPNDPTDADQDADQDGMTNLEEYIAGTNPRDPNSKLWISIGYTGTNAPVLLTFPAVSNHNYQVQSAGKMENAPNWNTFTNVAAAPINRSMTVTDPDKTTATDRYFRVRVR